MKRKRNGQFVKGGGRKGSKRKSGGKRSRRRAAPVIKWRTRSAPRPKSSGKRHKRSSSGGVGRVLVSMAVGGVGFLAAGAAATKIPSLNTPTKRGLFAGGVGLAAAVASEPLGKALPLVKVRHVQAAAIGAGIAGAAMLYPVLRSRVSALRMASGSTAGRLPSGNPPGLGRRIPRSLKDMAQLTQR